MSIRWLFPSETIDREGWYIAEELGKLAFFHQPHSNLMYFTMVINMPREHLTQEGAYEVTKRLTEMYTAPPIVEMCKQLTIEPTLIARPFDWIQVKRSWYRGRTLLIGDAAHATTAHMGMGGVMALEDAVVLAQCVAGTSSLSEAYEAFVDRRFERVRTVVDTSVALSKSEQENLMPGPEDKRLMDTGMEVRAQPY